MRLAAVSGTVVCLIMFPALVTAQDRFFDERVEPILRKRCLACHNEELKNGGVSFLDYNSLLEGGGRGPAVVPGKPDESLLIRAVRQEGALQMPPGATLSSQDVDTLTEWIARGASWGTGLRAVVRLPPAAFQELPKSIVRELEKRGCTIPQSDGIKGPHNVLSGQFAKSGQIDWATLCSKDRASTLLIFPKGSKRNPAALATTQDPASSFTRHIALEHRRSLRFDRDGIKDSASESSPKVHYYRRGKWLTESRAVR